jgi:Associated with HOX
MGTFYLKSTNQRDSACSSYQDSTIPTNMLYDTTEIAGNLLAVPASMALQSQFTGVPNAISNIGPDMGIGTQMMLLNGSAIQSQGLSLSLGTQIPVPVYQHRPSNSTQDFSNNRSTYPDPAVQSGILQNVNSNLKYLKAAQELLDEVVNVKEALKQRGKKNQSQGTATRLGAKEMTNPGAKIENNGQDLASNSVTELSPSERQDLQNKVTKLLAMLDEVCISIFNLNCFVSLVY